MIQEKLPPIEEQTDKNEIITPQQIQTFQEQEQSIQDICHKCIQICKRGQMKDNSSLIIEFLLKNKYLNDLEPADGNLLYYISKLVDYLEFETLSGVEEITKISNSKQYFILSGHALIVTPKKGKKLTSKVIWKIKNNTEKQQENEGQEDHTITSNQPKKKKKQKLKMVHPGDSFGETNEMKGAVIITKTELSVLSCSIEYFQKCLDLLLTKKTFINNCLARILSFVSLEEIEKDLSSKFKEQKFDANQFIFQKGEPLKQFYLLRQGCCQVFDTDSVDSSLVIPSSTLSSATKSFFVKIGEIFGHEDQSRATSSSNSTNALTRTFFCRSLAPNTIIYAIDRTIFLNSKNSKIISQILSHSMSKFRLLSTVKKTTNITTNPAERKPLQCLSPPSPILNKLLTTSKPLLPYDIHPKPFFLQDLSKQQNNILKISKTPTTPNNTLLTPKINSSANSLATSINELILKKKQHKEETKKKQKRSDSSDSEWFQNYYSGICSPRIMQGTLDRSNSQTPQISLQKNCNSKEVGNIIPEIKQNHSPKLSYSNSEKMLIKTITSPKTQTNSLLSSKKRSLTPLHNDLNSFNSKISNDSSNSIFSLIQSDTIIEDKNNYLQKQSENQKQQNMSNILIQLIKKSSLKRTDPQTSMLNTSLSPNTFQSSQSSMRINSREKSAFSDKNKLQNGTSQDKRVRFKELDEDNDHILIVNTKIIKNTATTYQTTKNNSPLLLPDLPPPISSILRKKEDCSPVKQFDYKSNSYRMLKKLSEVTEQRIFTMKKISSTQRNIILSKMNKKC